MHIFGVTITSKHLIVYTWKI